MTEIRPLHVLFIDDSIPDQEFLRVAFTKAFPDVLVTTASSGDEGMAVLRTAVPRLPADGPDIVLLDLKMPGKDGNQVLKEMRQEDGLRKIPVIMLTSSRLDEDISRAYDSGANAYIPKPPDALGYAVIAQELHRFFTETAVLPSGKRR